MFSTNLFGNFIPSIFCPPLEKVWGSYPHTLYLFTLHSSVFESDQMHSDVELGNLLRQVIGHQTLHRHRVELILKPHPGVVGGILHDGDALLIRIDDLDAGGSAGVPISFAGVADLLTGVLRSLLGGLVHDLALSVSQAGGPIQYKKWSFGI